MIKKILFALIGAAMCFNVFAETDMVDKTQPDKTIVWSPAALTDTINFLYRKHCPVSLEELYNVSDFMFKNNFKVSLNDVMKACQKRPTFNIALWEITVVKKNIECPVRDGEIKPGYKQVSGPSVKISYDSGGYVGSCEYFINKLIENQNKYEKKYGNDNDSLRQPGTYVEKVEDNVYKVVNVVKPEAKSTVVYVINKDKKSITKLTMPLYSYDMFIDIATTDNSRGIYNNSYIYTNIDFTKQIQDMAQQNSNSKNYIVNSVGLRPDWWLDIKSVYCKDGHVKEANRWAYKLAYDGVGNLKREGQSDTDCHTNGVIFQGKIVTLEWLGNYLFGYRKGVNTKPTYGVYDKMAELTQKKTSGKSDGQAQDDGEHIKKIHDIGTKDAEFAMHFYNTKTNSLDEAIKLVKRYLVDTKTAKTTEDIRCPKDEATSCRKQPGSQDYVVCYVGKIRYQFEFNSFCYTSSGNVYNNTYDGSGVFFRPGMK